MNVFAIFLHTFFTNICCIFTTFFVQFDEVILRYVNVIYLIMLLTGICRHKKGRIMWNQRNYQEGLSPAM